MCAECIAAVESPLAALAALVVAVRHHSWQLVMWQQVLVVKEAFAHWSLIMNHCLMMTTSPISHVCSHRGCYLLALLLM